MSPSERPRGWAPRGRWKGRQERKKLSTFYQLLMKKAFILYKIDTFCVFSKHRENPSTMRFRRRLRGLVLQRQTGFEPAVNVDFMRR